MSVKNIRLVKSLPRTGLICLTGAMLMANRASAISTVDLGAADAFAVLGGSAVTSSGPTIINGNVGASPGTAIAGFPPGLVVGTVHAGDGVASQAQIDLAIAYDDAASRSGVSTGASLGGTTQLPGVHSSGTFEITGTLTLDAQGNPDAVFIFQTASTLVTAAASVVNLINGAQANHVFWQVGSSATLGDFSDFTGNILALSSITATTGANIEGRLLARNGEVTLNSNVITRADGGVNASVPEAGNTMWILAAGFGLLFGLRRFNAIPS